MYSTASSARLTPTLSDERPPECARPDDGRGGIPSILAYMYHVNALVRTRDVQLFLDLFDKYGKPLGAVLNTKKI